jgi:hypothetical protein
MVCEITKVRASVGFRASSPLPDGLRDKVPGVIVGQARSFARVGATVSLPGNIAGGDARSPEKSARSGALPVCCGAA